MQGMYRWFFITSFGLLPDVKYCYVLMDFDVDLIFSRKLLILMGFNLLGSDFLSLINEC